MSEREFPVLRQGPREYLSAFDALECPRRVPWDFIAEHEGACLRNHDQSAETLASRGGLGPEEILAVIDPAPQKWAERTVWWHMKPEESVPRLKAALAEWMSRRSAQ